ncbi:MAG: 30S ribosome-binding factor RbfA [Caldilineales bacterium]|nr:30S ribosome-binding factor RbfA [Caldilineales bacterium]
MSQTYRKERLDELLLRELDSIIGYELADPRVSGVSVNRVDATRDLQVARIYVTLMDDSVSSDDALNGLHSAQGFIRSQIAERINLRRVPDLVFRIDRSLGETQRIEEIIDALTYAEDASEKDAPST